MAFKRFLNHDGTFNIERTGVRRSIYRDLYHALISASWPKLFAGVIAAYLVVNLVFGLLYFSCGPEALLGVRATHPGARFWECFFFSVQTLATIGYGQISPSSWASHLLVTVEALIGMTSVALTTGVMFARFSRPTARVIFSHKALIGEVDGDRLFYFRMANARLNQIFEAKVRATLVKSYVTSTGQRYRDFTDLKLIRDSSPIFALTWTVEHIIDAQSPLWNQNDSALRQQEVEILITVSGLDEGLAQPVYTRFSYTSDDLVWDRTFHDMIESKPDGRLKVHLDRIDDVI